jgi:diaminopropionate ammonia-lyase
MTVSEADLIGAPRRLKERQGPATTPSGAAGLAGLDRTLKDNTGARFGLNSDSRVLLVISEAGLEEDDE